MKTHRLLLFVATTIAGFVFCAGAYAQSASILGFDTGSNTKYECLRFGDPKLNNVRTTKGSKVKVVKISAAKAIVSDRLASTKSKKRTTKEFLKDANKELNKLLNNPFDLLNQNKIDKAKRKVAALTAKVDQLSIQIENLKKLLKDLGGCSKPGDPIINGTVNILSGLYNNGVSFYVVVAYVFDKSQSPSTGYLCGDISGETGTHPGWGGIVYNGGRPAMLVNPGRCSILGFECIDQSTQSMVFIQSKIGTEAPGHCSYRPSDCSVEAAVAEARTFFGNIVISNVKACSP